MNETELQKWKARFPNAKMSLNSYGATIYCDNEARRNLPIPCRRALSENRWKELGFEVIFGFRETHAIGFSTYKGLSAIYPDTAVSGAKSKLSVFDEEKIDREIRQMQAQIYSPCQPATARSQSDELADKWVAMRARHDDRIPKTGKSSASAPAPKVTLSEQEALDYLLGKPAEVFGPAWTLTECEPPNAFGRSMYCAL